jgi:hypothetical protein
VRLLPPNYVKADVKRSKNDANDAAAICEAVARPSMRRRSCATTISLSRTDSSHRPTCIVPAQARPGLRAASNRARWRCRCSAPRARPSGGLAALCLSAALRLRCAPCSEARDRAPRTQRPRAGGRWCAASAAAPDIPIGVSRRHRVINETGDPPAGQLRHALSPSGVAFPGWCYPVRATACPATYPQETSVASTSSRSGAFGCCFLC